MKHLLVLSVTFGLLLSSQTNLWSADAPAQKDKAVAKETKEKFRPFRGVVKAVDITGKKLTLEGEKAQEFKITAETKLAKDKITITLEQVIVGDLAGGRARQKDDGTWEAVTVNFKKVTPKADPPKKAAE